MGSPFGHSRRAGTIVRVGLLLFSVVASSSPLRAGAGTSQQAAAPAQNDNPTSPAATHALRAAAAGRPADAPIPGTQWYFAAQPTNGTDTGAGVRVEQTLALLNANAVPVPVTFTYSRPQATPLTKTATVGAGATLIENVAADAGTTRDVAITVRAPHVISAERVVRRVLPDGRVLGVDATPGTAIPVTRWYFAEGYTGLTYHEYLTVFNPGSHAAQVQVRFAPQAALPSGKAAAAAHAARGPAVQAVRPWTLVAPAGGQALLDVTQAYRSYPIKSVGLVVTSSVPIVAGRTLYWGAGQAAAQFGADVKPGQPASATWYFTGVSVQGQDQAFVTVVAPTNAASVRVQVRDSAGHLAQTSTMHVGAGNRATMLLHEMLRVQGPAQVTVTADVPVTAEIAQYNGGSPNQERHAGDVIAGLPQPTQYAHLPYLNSAAHAAVALVDIYNPGIAAIAVTVRGYSPAGLHATAQLAILAGQTTQFAVSRLGLGQGVIGITLATATGGFIAHAQSYAGVKDEFVSESAIPLPPAALVAVALTGAPPVAPPTGVPPTDVASPPPPTPAPADTAQPPTPILTGSYQQPQPVPIYYPPHTPVPTASQVATSTQLPQSVHISPTPTATVSATRTATATVSATRSPSATPTGTTHPTVGGTAPASPTVSATPTTTRTPVPPSSTLTGTPTVTSTDTATKTPTDTTTGTPVTASTQTDTSTATSTPTSTATGTPTRADTATGTPTSTSTGTATRIATATGTPTATVTATVTSTVTATSMPTATGTPGLVLGGKGSLWVTGHASDWYCFNGDDDGDDSGNIQSAGCHYLYQAVSFVRHGSSLPVLILDHGAASTAADWCAAQGGTSTAGSSLCSFPIRVGCQQGYCGPTNTPSDTTTATATATATSTGTPPVPTPGAPADFGGDVASAIGNAYQQNAPGASPQPQVLAVDPSSELFMSLPLVDNTGAPLYSAIVLASSCDKGYMSTGNPSVDDEVYSAYASRLGCDNTATDIAAVTGRVGAIGTFFNNGGGLLALSGGTLRDSYYKLLPIPVSAGGIARPYSLTALGRALGLDQGGSDVDYPDSPEDDSSDVNCCDALNSFAVPAPDSPLKVAETDGQGNAVTLVAAPDLPNPPADTPTETPTTTFTQGPTATPEPTPDICKLYGYNCPTGTPTDTGTSTPTGSPTQTNTPGGPTDTPTGSATATWTATASGTPTSTSTRGDPTPTSTGTSTQTATPTGTATTGGTPTQTNTPGGPTATNTGTATTTPTPTSTGTATRTGTPTSTSTNTATNTPQGPTATSTGTATATGTATQTATNTPIPNPKETVTAAITGPADTQQTVTQGPFFAPVTNTIVNLPELTAPTTITGSALVVNGTLASYSVAYAPVEASGPTQTFTTAFTGSSPVDNATLGTLDTTLIANGLYQLQITATAADGKSTTALGPQVRITGDLKVGNLRLGVQDLNVPVLGIPVQLDRSYDNFRHRVGDFGYNWQLDLHNPDLHLDACSFDITAQLPGSDQQLYFRFNPTWAQNLDGFDVYTPHWDADPTTAATISAANASNDFVLQGSDPDKAAYCWQLLFDDGSGSGTTSPYQPSSLTVATTDGTQWVIDGFSDPPVLSQVVEKNGAVLTFDPDGSVHSTINGKPGPSVTVQREPGGLKRITSVTDPDGKQVLYGYDPISGDLLTVEDRDQHTTTYYYDAMHDLTSIKDPTGRIPSISHYDNQGRLTGITTTDSNGVQHTVTFSTDLNAHQQTITDARGNAMLKVFDSYGDVLSVTDQQGKTTSYAYDSRHRISQRIDALGHQIDFTYDANNNRTDEIVHLDPNDPTKVNDIHTAFDATGNLTSYQFNGTKVMDFAYDSHGAPTLLTDAAGNQTTVTPEGDGSGLPQQVTLPGSAGSPSGTTQFTYYPTGAIETITDAAGQRTTYSRDDQGRVLETTVTKNGKTLQDLSYSYDNEGLPLSVVDKLQANSQQTSYYDAVGRVIEQDDANLNATKFQYDAEGRLSETDYADGSKVTRTYDAMSNVASETDQNGQTTTFVYDKDNRLVETDHPDGGTSFTRYDDAGRKTGQSDPTGIWTYYVYDAADRPIEVDNNEHQPIQKYVYDPVTGDRTTVFDAAGHRVDYSYTDHLQVGSSTHVTIGGSDTTVTSAKTYTARKQLRTAVDADGHVVTYSYDAAGNLQSVADPNSGPNGAYTALTQYGYDNAGNLSTLTDANNNITTFNYTAQNQALSTLYPGQSQPTRHSRYSAAGDVLGVDDASGQHLIAYGYDNMDRVHTVTYADHTLTVDYYPGGQRKKVTDSRGQVWSYDIDPMGRVKALHEPDGTEIDCTWDAAGRRTSLTTPAGKTTYTYDAEGRLWTVADPAGATTTYTYDARGNLHQRNVANASSTLVTRTVYGYDELNRLISLLTTNAAGATLWSDAYTLDNAGLRTGISEVDNAGTTTVYTYSYDQQKRLTGESQIRGGTTLVSATYTYDPVGNRTSRTDSSGKTTYDYNSRDQLLATHTPGGGGTTYTYDADGNLQTSTTGGVVTTYGYDVDDNLTSVTVGSTVAASYTYDADGNRASATDHASGVVTSYLVDPFGPSGLPQVVRESRTNGFIADYAYGNERISLDRGSGNTSFYLYDGNMNTRLLLDGSASVQDSYRYDAFGQVIDQHGAVPNPFLYDGQQYDAGTGLYYLRARYMDPTTGRFLSMDPASGSPVDPITFHRYLYAGDNPVSFSDPSGREFLADTLSSISIISTLQTGFSWVKKNGATIGNVLTTFAKFKSLLSALEKVRQAHSLTVAHAVATLYGKGTVEQTIQTFDKLTFCKLKPDKGSFGGTGGVVKGLLDVLCSNLSTGVLPGLIDFSGGGFGDSVGGQLVSSGLNAVALVVMEQYRKVAFEWVNELPLEGHYINQGFNDGYVTSVLQVAAGFKGLDFGLSVGKTLGANSGYVTAISDALKQAQTAVALILSEETLTALVAYTSDEWGSGEISPDQIPPATE